MGSVFRSIWGVAATLGTVSLGGWGIAAYTGRVLNGPRQQQWLDRYTFTPWEFQVPFEAIDFQTEDGVLLTGWWLPQPVATADSSRAIVILPGHKGLKTDLLGIASGLWRAGNSVLIFDFRGCGASARAPLSVGYLEQRDARAALAFVRDRSPEARLGIMGYSMGGAVAILVAATDPTIRAVVADSAYADLRDVVTNGFRRYPLPPAPFVALSDYYNGWRYHYRYDDLRPVARVGALAPRPLLLMHGEDDAITPVSHAHALYAAAAEPKELWLFPNTPHCGGYFQDRALYVDCVAAFFERHLT